MLTLESFLRLKSESGCSQAMFTKRLNMFCVFMSSLSLIGGRAVQCLSSYSLLCSHSLILSFNWIILFEDRSFPPKAIKLRVLRCCRAETEKLSVHKTHLNQQFCFRSRDKVWLCDSNWGIGMELIPKYWLKEPFFYGGRETETVCCCWTLYL